MGAANRIEEVRLNIGKYFSEANIEPDQKTEYISPDGKYRIVKNVYTQTVTDYNWKISEIGLFDAAGSAIYSLLIDDDRFFHHWLFEGEREYLLFAESLCGGNSVFNLKTRTLKSHADGTDGFIFTEYLPSPDAKRIAVSGCYWASQYLIRIFDVSCIESLPWPMIKDVQIYDEEETSISWLDANTIRVYKYSNANLEISRDIKFA